jgi:hypothetical protein
MNLAAQFTNNLSKSSKKIKKRKFGLKRKPFQESKEKKRLKSCL